jgi:tetratricopeptide (TPR) repeat protein
MTSLKAFVGHSFTTDDEDVVRTFLKYFDQVEVLNIGFSWEHAEPAETKELAEKVLRLMEGKNLFIGICTKKEATILPSNLSRTKLDKTILKGREDHFLWKTSDWIIQEIGLAIGKGMDLILLVEAGLRQPGGLQGNKEYISFDRQAPEKSFGKVLEMIQSLIPKAKVLAAEGLGTRAASAEKAEAEEKKGEDWWKPKDNWQREDFEIVWLHMIATDNKEGAAKISQAYLATHEGQSPQNRESWEAHQELYLLEFGKGGRLTNLDEMARAHPDNSEVLKYRAKGYQKFGEQEKAAQLFETAAKKARGQKQELARYGDAALAYTQAGQKADARRVIETMKEIAPKVEDGKEQLIRALRDIAEVDTDKDCFFGLTETLLDLCPGDIDARFSLALKYSEEGQGELSLYHYLKIPYQQRDAGTWNNLGVQFAHCNLDNKSVEAYQKAEKLGETLAMSNLAQKLISAGFLKEAEEICNRAIKVESYHKNVGYAITRIKEIPEAEEKKEAEVIKSVTPISDFYKDYGRAITANQIAECVGGWQGPDCELKITVKGSAFLAEGSYERSVSSALALLLTASPVPSAKVIRYLVRYEGTIVGRAVQAVFTRKKEGETEAPPSILGIADKGKDVLLIMAESLKEFRAYEKSATKEKQFFTLNRIDGRKTC